MSYKEYEEEKIKKEKLKGKQMKLEDFFIVEEK